MTTQAMKHMNMIKLPKQSPAHGVRKLNMQFVFVVHLAVVMLSTLVMLSCQYSALAEGRMIAGESAWHPTGLFAYVYSHDGGREIRVFKHAGGEVRSIFRKEMSTTIKPPICLSNDVVIVTTEGQITKFDLKGELVFQQALDRFSGVAGFSGRIGDRYVYVTETIYNSKEKKWEFYLYVVDVSGKEPVVTSRQSIIHPNKVTRIADHLIVVGPKKTQRLRLPGTVEVGRLEDNAE